MFCFVANMFILHIEYAYVTLNVSLPFNENIGSESLFACSFDCESLVNIVHRKFKMDRFVTRKRKLDATDEGATGDSATSSENRPVAEEQQLPQSVENEKPKSAVRKFHVEWENQFLVTEYKRKAICLICRHSFTEFRKFLFERHFNTHHIVFDAKFPVSSKKRVDEISRLKNDLTNEQKVVKKFVDTNELITRASYEITYEIAKHGKPYLDGEFHKRLMLSTIKTLCESWDEKPKQILLENVNKVPLSHQTVSRRVNEIGAQLAANLQRDLEQCESFSIALDETTDIKDEAQLLFWVRYFIGDRTGEGILALVSLPEHTTADDIFNAFQATVTRFNLDLKKLASICTDGAPAMLGIHNGFAALVKKHAAKDFDNRHVISYHCIIHQENLCAKALQRSCNVVQTVTKVRTVAIYVPYFVSSIVCLFFICSFDCLVLIYR